MNGTITCQFTVWCNNCTNWERVSADCKRSAEIEFQRDGWTERSGRWYCKDCYDKACKHRYNETAVLKFKL